MRAEAAGLLRKGRQARSFVITEEHLAGLPEAVQRYLRGVGVAGKEAIRTLRLKQQGFFRAKPGGKWFPMTAEQYFATSPPAFLWYGRVQIFPFSTILAADSFIDGHGKMLAKFLSLIRVADASGPEMDQGALLRYLVEIIWFPTAWLSGCIQWKSIDAHSAKATLRHAGLTVSAVLHFNEDGLLDQVTAERYWVENGKFALRKWSGRVEDYREAGGMRIPMKVEVLWHLDPGDFSYFRAGITEIEYHV